MEERPGPAWVGGAPAHHQVRHTQATASLRRSRIDVSVGVATVAKDTLGFWIHLDADVIDVSELPAVDCPEPDGPPLSTVSPLLRTLVAAPGFVGMDITIYDPDLDPSGACADRLMRCLAEVFLPMDAFR